MWSVPSSADILALNSVGGFTLGGLASFLTFNKSFNMPINQVSQQLNAIVMALAGAERIFSLMDTTVETDEGYVTLVNARDRERQADRDAKSVPATGHGNIHIRRTAAWTTYR